LAAFLKDHHDRVPYDLLPRHVQVFLISLGYPAKDAAEFRATVKSILEDVGGRKKRCDAREVDSAPRPASRGRPIAARPMLAAVAAPASAFAASV
jgi:hypothetical protein